MDLDPSTIRHIVGPLDDAVVARIARTGITREQLKEAALRVTGSEERANLEIAGAPVVRAVVQLLEEQALAEEPPLVDAECMD